MTEVRSEVTSILARLGSDREPEPGDRERLLDIMYEELRRVAGALMTRERREVTLQPTALVHEAYFRLVEPPEAGWTGRAHFLAVAARCMRNILVDHARARRAQKRGGDQPPLAIDDTLIGEEPRAIEALMVHDALTKLAELDPRAADVAQMRLFGGMTVKEVAEALEVSTRTVDGDWSTARLWLSRELRGG